MIFFQPFSKESHVNILQYIRLILSLEKIVQSPDLEDKGQYLLSTYSMQHVVSP